MWVTDPTIRDFVGLAENQWDFTKPDSVPGFGTLELAPELRQIVARLLGSAPQGSQEHPTIDADNNPLDAENNPLESVQANPTVCQHDNGNMEKTEDRKFVAANPPGHRTHGGALPK